MSYYLQLTAKGKFLGSALGCPVMDPGWTRPSQRLPLPNYRRLPTFAFALALFHCMRKVAACQVPGEDQVFTLLASKGDHRHLHCTLLCSSGKHERVYKNKKIKRERRDI